eukprot:186915-Rhodomonas_salina.2
MATSFEGSGRKYLKKFICRLSMDRSDEANDQKHRHQAPRHHLIRGTPLVLLVTSGGRIYCRYARSNCKGGGAENLNSVGERGATCRRSHGGN